MRGLPLGLRYTKKMIPTSEEETRVIRETVSEIIHHVKTDGERAVREYMAKFDGWAPKSFKITQQQIDQAEKSLPEDLKRDIRFLHNEVERFARAQLDRLSDFEIETLPGVHVGQKYIPVQSLGVYIPGGRYTLIASAQMSIVPAKVAGVRRIVACTPPKDGRINPAMLYSTSVAGADEVYSLAGAQAIAAMTWGTTEMRPVDMVAGPGNKYVVEAKRQLYGTVGIDFIPGPTEILIIADESENPEIVAAELLAQSEHDVDSKATLITTSDRLATEVMAQIEVQLRSLATSETASRCWRQNGEIVIVENREDAVSLADEYAPEHLQIMTGDPSWFFQRVRNYGTAFLGEFASTVYSDKAIGPNHILPTGRGARYTGGLWVGKYLKNVTYQWMTKEGSMPVASVAARIARAEGMVGHAISAEKRLTEYGG